MPSRKHFQEDIKSVGTIGIAGTLAISAVVHVTLLSAGGFALHAAPAKGGQAMQVVLRTAEPTRTKAPAEPEAMVRIDRSVVAATSPAQAGTDGGKPLPVENVHGDGGDIQRAPRAASPFAIADFDPARYLTVKQVDQGAVPVDPEWIDHVPLSGFEPGSWMVRLFVNEGGAVDEVELVESKGRRVNGEELRAYLATSRFEPARLGNEAVKSQMMIEIQFKPEGTTRLPP
jgi:hypothetical protein